MEISTDKARLNVSLIHHFLSEQSAWAKGIPLETVQRSIEHSLCFGAYIDGQQIAFARVVTDKATFAYLMDVFVLPAYRGQGHAKTLMHAVQEHPDLQEIRRFILVSSTARGLYEKFGFQAPTKPETFMEINRPTIYLR
ncbi:GNAT family N-acetyltransferase [Undibacterium sp. SXout11W]|uniref:GNAT family N-acetyltransferase n=1 Tax=Undibacterium sp. SXout11W TaxID=3413050 RepID=UPI003BF1361F